MAYIENRMCNLQLWESVQEEVVCLKNPNNYIYALTGISPGLTGICIQMQGFSVCSEFQNEHAIGLS